MLKENGFTLVEMLIVLVITFTLLFVTGSLVFNMKEKVTFETYLQQFKLLNYEAYSRAIADERIISVMCYDNEPHLLHHDTSVRPRQLYWPEHIEMKCDTKHGPRIVYDNRYGIDFIGGSMRLKDHQLRKDVKYTVLFTYGRIKKAE